MKKKQVRKDVKDTFSEFSERTQLFINNCKIYLEKNVGKINETWEEALYMLASNVETFHQCEREIRENGLLMADRFGGVIKNPCLKVQTDAEIQIIKILNEFGLTLKASTKISALESNEEGTFLDDVLNGQ